MTATINDMKLRFADYLLPNQLMEGDLIKLDEEYLIVKSIVENLEGVNVVLINDFEETLETFFFDDESIELYVFVE